MNEMLTLLEMIGDDGGDVGNELAFVFSIVAYMPARWAEKRYIGR